MAAADTVTITVIATGLDEGDSLGGSRSSFSASLNSSRPSFLNNNASKPRRSGLSFLDGMNGKTGARTADTRTQPSNALEEDMPVISHRGVSGPAAGEKQGMEGIKIPTFIQNKKQED